MFISTKINQPDNICAPGNAAFGFTRAMQAPHAYVPIWLEPNGGCSFGGGKSEAALQGCKDEKNLSEFFEASAGAPKSV